MILFRKSGVSRIASEMAHTDTQARISEPKTGFVPKWCPDFTDFQGFCRECLREVRYGHIGSREESRGSL